MSEPRYLVYDIETIPCSETAADWVDDGKFPPIHVHRIVALGMLQLAGNLQVVASAMHLAEDDIQEKALVEAWNAMAISNGRSLKIVDYNGRGFDAPVLQTRALRHFVQLPWFFGKVEDNRGMTSSFSKEYRDRYSGHHLDLCEMYTAHGAFKSQPLSALCRLIGLPGKREMDGSKVHVAYVAKEMEKIGAYVKEDVISTAFLMMRMAFLEGKVTAETFRSAAEAMLEHAKLYASTEFVEAIDRARLLGVA